MNISGSVALVTGANRGLGLAFTRELVRRGAATVYGAARDPGKVTEPGVSSRSPWTSPTAIRWNGPPSSAPTSACW
jgi:NAD(P)-dependent dehydrogenase (short-subunit alcohol dehydrogenase family)